MSSSSENTNEYIPSDFIVYLANLIKYTISLENNIQKLDDDISKIKIDDKLSNLDNLHINKMILISQLQNTQLEINKISIILNNELAEYKKQMEEQKIEEFLLIKKMIINISNS